MVPMAHGVAHQDLLAVVVDPVVTVETVAMVKAAVKAVEAHMVAVAVHIITVVLPLVRPAQSESSGPVILVASHQQIQETCNA